MSSSYASPWSIPPVSRMCGRNGCRSCRSTPPASPTCSSAPRSVLVHYRCPRFVVKIVTEAASFRRRVPFPTVSASDLEIKRLPRRLTFRILSRPLKYPCVRVHNVLERSFPCVRAGAPAVGAEAQRAWTFAAVEILTSRNKGASIASHREEVCLLFQLGTLLLCYSDAPLAHLPPRRSVPWQPHASVASSPAAAKRMEWVLVCLHRSEQTCSKISVFFDPFM